MKNKHLHKSKTDKSIFSKNYRSFLIEIKSKIVSARISVARRINNELIKLYWDIGKAIVNRQRKYGWGQSIVEKLASDLQREFGAKYGFSASNLWRMRTFVLAYHKNIKLAQLVREIPWGHNVLIIEKIKNLIEQEYYIKATIQFGWSRNVLLNQIKANAYARSKTMPKTHNFPKALPAYLAEQADESLKSSYNLDFLGITGKIAERDLEKRLTEQVKQLMLELGYGFTFIGNQYRLILGNNEYFIDLLFFNRRLKCLVAVELKTSKFEPEYAGKMDFYLHILNEQAKRADENPSIGIILCAHKDNIDVEYALRGVKNPMGVAQYRLTKTLPKKLKNALPTPAQIKKKLSEKL